MVCSLALPLSLSAAFFKSKTSAAFDNLPKKKKMESNIRHRGYVQSISDSRPSSDLLTEERWVQKYTYVSSDICMLVTIVVINDI